MGGFEIFFGVVAALIGVAFVLIGLRSMQLARTTKRVLQEGLPVKAEVVSIRTDRRTDSDGSTSRTHWTTVRYTHPRTEAVQTVEVPVPNALRGRPVGEVVDLLVDPQDPAMLVPPRTPVGLATGIFAVFVVIGVVVVVAGAVFAVHALTSGSAGPGEIPLP